VAWRSISWPNGHARRLTPGVQQQAHALEAERKEAEAEYQRLMEQARTVRQRVRLREAALSRLARTVTEAEPAALADLVHGDRGGP
jgi:cell division protein FtsL